MAADEQTHNEITGQGAGSIFQGRDIYGDVVFSPPSVRRGVDESRMQLAGQLTPWVRDLSNREGETWRIGDPRPLSVQWHPAADDLSDHWTNIHSAGKHGDDDPVSLAGGFTGIRTTYEAVPSKRLVILGRAGAGKTMLAHRLIPALLDDDNLTGRVPVLFSLSGWDARSLRLRDWMIHQLRRR